MPHFDEERVLNETRLSMCTFALFNMQSIETTHKWYTHMPEPVYEEGDIAMLSNQKKRKHAY